MSAIGQAAVVIVRSTSTARLRDVDPVDEAEVDDVHPGLGIVDLHQRVAHGVVVDRHRHGMPTCVLRRCASDAGRASMRDRGENASRCAGAKPVS